MDIITKPKQQWGKKRKLVPIYVDEAVRDALSAYTSEMRSTTGENLSLGRVTASLTMKETRVRQIYRKLKQETKHVRINESTEN